jgi:valyl-tRNA synthetase
MSRIPDKPTPDGLEERWIERWDDEGTYHFDRSARRADVYAVDTPPPTVSGSLHVGHIFSYTHTDIVARYQRMRGRDVFYPIGWDDNGLPTERRVQQYYGVTCDPSLPLDPSFAPPGEPADPPIAISRPDFVSLCHGLTEQDERVFEELFRRIGLSVDWRHKYTTVSPEAQRVSQRMFLRNLARGEAYSAEAPTIWDVTFQTAVAQAEIEDRERPGAYHRIGFAHADGGEPVAIETTRPELIPACVALVAHPDDERYQPLFGTRVVTPLFGVEVEVRAHVLADPEKGSGIAMICTFGDTTDVTWWRELGLGIRPVLTRSGRLRDLEWGSPGWESRDVAGAQAAYDQLAGKTVKQAQRRIVELLDESGDLLADPRPVEHTVKFYERGDRPLEIVTSRQWYIRNGGRDAELRDALVARGDALTWWPAHMVARYRAWVEGLTGDWLISRQRFFGVPFPVWYPLDDDGEPDYDHPLVPSEDALPVDPTTATPPGYEASQRGRPGGFGADPDVMDTWATSSLTPHIAGRWEDDPDLFERVFPMDVRPQAHEIIRTWLFSTVVRSHFEHGSLPWSNATISGWILDPDRKKMSKSKGNVVTPMALLEKYGSDAVRYWAASARPGVDTAFDEQVMKVGRRLAVKLLNASKFVLNLSEGAPGEATISDPLDRSMLAALAAVVEESTAAFEHFDYARALERTEAFFWTFTDDYVELVKTRAYGEEGEEGAASARAALRLALSTFQRLLAPHLPFVAEETWSWWQEGSIHRAGWPDAATLVAAGGDAGSDVELLGVVGRVLSEVRRAKTEAKRSLRAEVDQVEIVDTAARLAQVDAAAHDLRAAGRIAELVLVEGDAAAVTTTLASEDPAA